MKKFIVFAVFITFFVSLCAQDYDFRKTRWGMNVNSVKASESAKLFTETGNMLGYIDSIAGYDCTISYYFEKGILTKTQYILEINYDRDKRHKYIDDYYILKRILTQKYGQPKEDQKAFDNTICLNIIKDNKESLLKYENKLRSVGLNPKDPSLKYSSDPDVRVAYSIIQDVKQRIEEYTQKAKGQLTDRAKGDALASGYLGYYATWNTKTTEIMIILGSDVIETEQKEDIDLIIEYSDISKILSDF